MYIWVTNNLQKRNWEHKNNDIDWFSKNYNLNKLVYYEDFDDINAAIGREKQLKNWRREWKIDLIQSMNTDWTDLFDSL